MSSDWLSVASLLSDISRSMACSAFIHDGHVLKRKRSVLSIKDKNEFADDNRGSTVIKLMLVTYNFTRNEQTKKYQHT